MTTAGLDALKGILTNACGDLVTSSQQAEGLVVLRVRQSHSDSFKAAVHGYVKGYNKTHGTKISASFPKPFSVHLREHKKTSRSGR